MAFKVLSILRTIGPLIVDAGRLAAGLRTSGSAVKIDDRVMKLEQEAIRAGEIIRGLAEQLHAVAQELRVQAEATAALQRKTKYLLIVSITALCGGIAAIVVSLVQ